MKTRAPKNPASSSARPGKKLTRKKPAIAAKQDPLFESMRQELGL